MVRKPWQAWQRGLGSILTGLLILGLLAGCGGSGSSSGGTTGPTTSVTQTIGSAGGTVSLPDGNAVTFSSGTLKDGTPVKVSIALTPQVPMAPYEDLLSSGIRVEVPGNALADNPPPTAGLALSYKPSASPLPSVGALANKPALLSGAYRVIRTTISRGGKSIVTYSRYALDEAGRAVLWVERKYIDAVNVVGNEVADVVMEVRDTAVARCLAEQLGKIYQVLDPSTFIDSNFSTGGTRVPLVLVHGFQVGLDCGKEAYKDTWATFISKFFDDSKFSEIKENLLLFTFSYDTSKSISESGSLLAQEIKKIPGAPPVVVLAHSMGGLVARSALVNNKAAIQGLVTLATPHHGTLRFRTPDVLRSIIQRGLGVTITDVVTQDFQDVVLDTQGAKQLDWDNFDGKISACKPTCNDFLKSLNDVDNNWSRYVVFAGKARSASGLSAAQRDLIQLVALETGIPPENDGVVPEVSALFRGRDYSPQPLRFHKSLDPPDHEAIHESPAIDDPEIRSALLGFVASPPTPPSTFTLTVTVSGSGTVTGPNGITCGNGTCPFSIASGTTLVLTPAAASGSTFVGWSGDCTGAICSVTMTQDRSVTATFSLVAPPPSTQFTLYGVDNDTDQLVTLTVFPPGSPEGGFSGLVQSTPVGPIGFTSVRGLAYDPQIDKLYAIDHSTQAGQLIIIDRSTGRGTAIGPIGLDRPETDPNYLGSFITDLTFGPGNTLLGLAGGGANTRRLIRFNTLTGQGVLVGGAVIGGELSGLTFVPQSGRLFATGFLVPGRLHELNPSTGAIIDTLPEFIGPSLMFLTTNPTTGRFIGLYWFSDGGFGFSLSEFGLDGSSTGLGLGGFGRVPGSFMTGLESVTGPVPPIP